jgi:hypothetical protein
MKTMDADKLDELERLLAEATPGPWYLADWTSDDGLDLTTIEARNPEVLRPGQSSIWPDGIECSRVAETAQGERPLEDAALIVAAINALPELVAMGRERTELQAVFEAQWGAEMRAKQRWQIATGKEGTWPDRANLVVWLMERVEKLETALKPFAEFAPQAERFVSDAAKNDGSPMMPTKHFRLSDFERARAALKGTPT